MRINNKRGFTLMELLIVIAIIAVLVLLILANWKKQIQKGYDVKRKTDLENIHRVFEEYYNDNGCYPPDDILNECGSTTALSPYMKKIPCDPESKLPYYYVPNGDRCSGYRTLSTLSNLNDPDIVRVGCASWGCGYDGAYNWGVSAGVPVPNTGFQLDITPTPTTSTTFAGNYACAPAHEGEPGTCNNYGDPQAAGCPRSWASACELGCNNPAYWCAE